MFTSFICAQIKIEEGEINGAKYYVAVPEQWNNKLVVLAHGLRPDDAPLDATFSVANSFYKDLLDEGWMIASSSYRRSGLIVRDAVKDIDALKKHIVSTHSKPDKTFIIGTSMGGAIAVYIAENRSIEEYNGVLGIGPAIFCIENENPYEYSYSPNMPTLFVSNQNELTSPQGYTEKAQSGTFTPAIWYVKRDGHCNITDDEQAVAFNGLLAYSQTGTVVKTRDLTIEVESSKSQAVMKGDTSYAKVSTVHPSYGNVTTTFVQSDLTQLGILLQSYFHVGFNQNKFRVYLGTAYSDVKKGEWIAFYTAEGYLQVARNFDNAAKALECTKDDLIYICK